MNKLFVYLAHYKFPVPYLLCIKIVISKTQQIHIKERF